MMRIQNFNVRLGVAIAGDVDRFIAGNFSEETIADHGVKSHRS